MKHLKLSVLKTLCAVAATAATSAIAAPIFSAADTVGGPARGTAPVADTAPMFSHMRLNGGQSYTVAFLSDDNSVLIGHYSRGPWSKSQFLRPSQNSEGGGDFLPPAQTLTSLPEPSTLALLGLGLLAVGVLKRRQSSS